MPHRIFADYRLLCLLAAAGSLGLSLWAIYMDPVINRDGVYYIQAAESFALGNWQEALAVYKWPFYSFLVAGFIELTGLAPGHATYLVNSLLYVMLVTGFIAMVRSLGGKGSVLWIAALVILLYPAMNKFRPFVIRDIGYWACYLWSLAFFYAYVREGHGRLLGIWAVLMFLAFLFRVEGLALLLMLPGWLLATKAPARWSVAGRVLAAAAGLFILSGFTLWQYVSESGAGAADLISSPLVHIVDSWGAAGQDLSRRLVGLDRELAGGLSPWLGMPVYAATLVVLIVVECADALGVVYAGLVIWILVRRGAGFEPETRYWWHVVICLQVLLLVAFAFLNFFLADRYPVGLALTLLAPVPFFLDGLWRRWRARTRRVEWAPLLVVALLVVSSVEGLDVGTEKRYLKQAGLWLREQGTAGDKTVYSNSLILSYYAGAAGETPRPEYSWERAMRLIWTGDWRRYDYLAVMMEGARTRHEPLIARKIGGPPQIQFKNQDGDRVLIFTSRGGGA